MADDKTNTVPNPALGHLVKDGWPQTPEASQTAEQHHSHDLVPNLTHPAGRGPDTAATKGGGNVNNAGPVRQQTDVPFRLV